MLKSLEGVKTLIFNFKELDYISSSGLRVLLAMEKNMRRQGGKMTLKNVNASIKEIIKLAGFLQVMHVED